jgi:hypothetical protein
MRRMRITEKRVDNNADKSRTAIQPSSIIDALKQE